MPYPLKHRPHDWLQHDACHFDQFMIAVHQPLHGADKPVLDEEGLHQGEERRRSGQDREENGKPANVLDGLSKGVRLQRLSVPPIERTSVHAIPQPSARLPSHFCAPCSLSPPALTMNSTRGRCGNATAKPSPLQITGTRATVRCTGSSTALRLSSPHRSRRAPTYSGLWNAPPCETHPT